MNRRSFVKKTALAATLVAVAPSVMASGLEKGKKKQLIFIFRGVSYLDGEAAFKKANFADPNTHFQKIICTNPSYSHLHGFDTIISNLKAKDQRVGVESQNLDRYRYAEILEDLLHSSGSNASIVHLHHTEIAHSSYKIHLASLDEFFTELSKIYNPKLHRIIVTADIGRNEKLNSCGGKDHSNETCLETFALYMGGKSSKLKSNTQPIQQNQILQQKF